MQYYKTIFCRQFRGKLYGQYQNSFRDNFSDDFSDNFNDKFTRTFLAQPRAGAAYWTERVFGLVFTSNSKMVFTRFTQTFNTLCWSKATRFS